MTNATLTLKHLALLNWQMLSDEERQRLAHTVRIVAKSSVRAAWASPKHLARGFK